MNTSSCTKELFEDESCEESAGCYEDFVELDETTTVKAVKHHYKHQKKSSKYSYETWTEAPQEMTTLLPLPNPEHQQQVWVYCMRSWSYWLITEMETGSFASVP